MKLCVNYFFDVTCLDYIYLHLGTKDNLSLKYQIEDNKTLDSLSENILNAYFKDFELIATNHNYKIEMIVRELIFIHNENSDKKEELIKDIENFLIKNTLFYL